jgi:hypothetical protein
LSAVDFVNLARTWTAHRRLLNLGRDPWVETVYTNVKKEQKQLAAFRALISRRLGPLGLKTSSTAGLVHFLGHACGESSSVLCRASVE